MRDILSPGTRQLAERLIQHQVSGQPPPSNTVPAAQVFNALRQHLCALVGVSGLRVLLDRALVLARAEVRELSVVAVRADASLTGLDELRHQDDPDGGAALLAQLLGLLGAFIGEALTVNILLDIWPDLAAPTPGPAAEEPRHDATG